MAYDSLLQRRRIPLHRSILQSSETLYANRLNERADQLAHHALRGEVWDKAFTYLRQAGNSAVARSAYREAVTYFNRAHDVFEHLPKNEDILSHRLWTFSLPPERPTLRSASSTRCMTTWPRRNTWRSGSMTGRGAARWLPI